MIYAISVYLVLLPFLPPAPAALCLLLLAGFFALTGLRQPASSWRFILPILPFLASNILAVLRSANPTLAAGFFSFFMPGLVLFVILRQDRSLRPGAVMHALTIFTLILALSILLGWLRVMSGAASLAGEDLPQAALRLSNNRLFVVPNDACLIAVFAAFPLGLLRQRTLGISRVLAPGLALATLVLSLVSLAIVRSRTGLAIAGAEMVFALLLQPRLLAFVVPIVLAGVAADVLFSLHSLEKLRFAGAQDFHGLEGRFGLWIAAWRMFLTAPVFGHGGQSFGPGHWAYLPSWAPRFPEGHVLWAHDLPLDLLAEQGVIGIATFILCFVQPVRAAVKNFRFSRSKVIRSQGETALLAFAGFFLAAGFEFSLIRRAVPLLLFLLLGFALLPAAQDDDHDPIHRLS